jgi:hypothetical protein
MRRIFFSLLGCSTLLFFSGCGGGNETASNVPVPVPVPVPVTTPDTSTPNESSPVTSESDQYAAMMEQMQREQAATENASVGTESDQYAAMMAQMQREQEESEKKSDSTDSAQYAAMMEQMQREQAASANSSDSTDSDAYRRQMEEMQKREQGANGTMTDEEYMRMMGDASNPNGGGQYGPKKEIPKTLLGKSERAFAENRDTDAFKYLYAHYLIDGMSDLQMQLYPGLKAPRAALRFGVCIDYSAPKMFKKAPPQIGSKPNVLPGSNSGGYENMDPNMGGMGGNGAEPKDAMGMLDFYTGPVGRRVLEAINDRRVEKAFLGHALETVEFKMPEAKNGGGMDDMQMQMQMQMMQGGGGGGAPAVVQGEQNQLIPGVVFLGMGDAKEKMREAQNIDLVIEFNVRVGVARNGLESNNTLVSVYNTTTGRSVYKTSKPLNNVSQWKAMEKEEDTIADMIEQMFEKSIDPEFSPLPMPELTADQAFSRVKSLIGEDQKYEDPLPILLEVSSYYHSPNKLLEENAYKYAVAHLIGDSTAEKFLAGDEKQKTEAISRFLPKNWEEGLQWGGEVPVSADAPVAATKK